MSKAELTKRGALGLVVASLFGVLVFGECISIRNRRTAQAGDERREVLAHDIQQMLADAAAERAAIRAEIAAIRAELALER